VETSEVFFCEEFPCLLLALTSCVVSVDFILGSSSMYKKKRAFSRVPEKKK
jgi:hypothetical protein